MEIVQEISRTKVISKRNVYNGNGWHAFHWHENIEICQTVHQNMDYVIGGKFVHTQPGDIVVIGDHTVHKFLPAENGTTIKLLQMQHQLLVNARCRMQPIKVHITKAELDEHPQIAELVAILFDVIENEGIVKVTDENPISQCAALTLYAALMKYFPAEHMEVNKGERKEFYDIVEYINKHFTEDISVQGIANAMYMGRSKLSRIFTQYAGTSLNTYINGLRISKANELLNAGADVTDAAFESGFQSIRTFNSVYKKIVGVTPSEYKNKTV